MADIWFTIHRSSIMPALSHVSRAIEGKSDIPILSHVFITAEGETLRLRGTNLDLQIQAECELMTLTAPQSFALPSAQLHDILRQLPENAEISFTSGRTRDQVGIRSGRSVFSVPFLPASDFPEIRGKADLDWTQIDGAKLADAISKTSYAVNKKDVSRDYLSGLCLHGDTAGTGMVMCGTDGLSLACVEMQGAGFPPFPKRANYNDTFPHVILPMRAADCLLKLLDGAKTPAEIAVTENFASVRFEGIEISTKLIDGIYPLYEQVIPTRTEQTIVVSHDVLSAAVKRVCSVQEDDLIDGIRLRIVKGVLELDLLTAHGGFARDSVSAEVNVPEGFTIAHNATRMERMLATIKASDIELILTNHETAILISPLGNPHERYILRPMNPRYVAE